MPHLTRRQALAGAAALATIPAPIPASASPPRRQLGNPRAAPEARRLYRFLWSIYGRRTLTGQQERPVPPRDELDYLQRTTGRLPAILGLDFIIPADWEALHERAIAWHRAGGIVTLCWHWGAPDVGTGYENSKLDFPDWARAGSRPFGCKGLREACKLKRGLSPERGAGREHAFKL